MCGFQCCASMRSRRRSSWACGRPCLISTFDIIATPLGRLGRVRWFSLAVESVSGLCCSAQQGRQMKYSATITSKPGRTPELRFGRLRAAPDATVKVKAVQLHLMGSGGETGPWQG